MTSRMRNKCVFRNFERKSAGLFGGRGRWFVRTAAAVLATAVTATAAHAQCREDFSVALFAPGGQAFPAAVASPLGNGSSLAAFVSTINTVNTSFATQTSAFVSGNKRQGVDVSANGVWMRGIGGSSDTENTSTASLDLSRVPAAAAFVPVQGAQTCDTEVRTNYGGVQFGFDIARLNLSGDGGNIFVGATGGWIRATTKDQTPGNNFINPRVPAAGVLNVPEGEFESETDVPFVGVYVAYTKNNFYIDGQVRGDRYKTDLSASSSGLTDESLDARGISVSGNAGFQAQMGPNFAIIPSVGLTWSRVQVDDLFVPGFDDPAGSGTFLGRGVVSVDDIESLLGRLSLRFVTSFKSGQVNFQPFITASVFREFAEDVTASSLTSDTGNAGIDNAVLNMSMDRIGTYGQLGLGTSFVMADTGWQGYVRGDYRKGDQIEGWGVSGGLRYNFDSPLGQ